MKKIKLDPNRINQKIYDRFARSYWEKRQDLKRSLYNEFLEIRPMRKILLPLINEKKSKKKILDLGCGSGQMSAWISKCDPHAKVIGVDASSKMLELAKENYSYLQFEQTFSHKLYFADKYFDIVTSSLMIHYLKDLGPTFKAVSRVLKNHGHFVFSIHHPVGEVLKKNKYGALVLKNYFHQDWYRWKMFPGMNLMSYHHTFETIVEALNKNHFSLLEIIEPRPAKILAKRYPDFYKSSSQNPSFCLLHAVRRPR